MGGIKFPKIRLPKIKLPKSWPPKKKPKKSPPPQQKKVHPWRVCPLGQHWVRTHPMRIPPGQKNPSGTTIRDGHCANNPSRKDQLYRDEIQLITQKHFWRLKGLPTPNKLKYDNGNDFDPLIRGWVRYWNEVLKPKEPLDPDIVKALIATESGFNPNSWNKRKGPRAAYGLMQVLKPTISYLKEESNELKDHFITLDQNDLNDPNLNICAGVRWLFRKKEIAEARLKRPVSWWEAICVYKGYKITDKNQRGMKNFDEKFKELKIY